MPEPDLRLNQRRVFAYVYQRRAIGVIGTALPFVLIIGHAFLRAVLLGPPAWRGWDLQRSMSDYYHTNMGNVFVGALCAIGVFLLSYEGDGKADAWAGSFAGICAIGVGLFPTNPPGSGADIISDFHVGFAVALYFMLAFFSIVLFTRAERAATRRVNLRKLLYRICGWWIIGGLLTMGVFYNSPSLRPYIGTYHVALWLESSATVAFGISWLIRGEKIFRDVDGSV